MQHRLAFTKLGAAAGWAHGVVLLVLLVSAGRAAAEVTIAHLAGSPGGPGWYDGTGNAARLNSPTAAAADGAGNVYVADCDNHVIRRVVSATGAVTTLAGLAGNPGSADGIGGAARFYYPQGIASDGAGNVYVADSYNQTIRKIVVATGDVTTLAGSPGATGRNLDGIGSAARFNLPSGVAADGDGIVYVADTNNETIRRVVVATGAVTTLAGLAQKFGSADGIGSVARFFRPYGIAADGAGNVYVADSQNNKIRKIVVATAAVTTLAGLAGGGNSGSADGIGSAARFLLPYGIASDGAGNVYVADTNNLTIRKIVAATGAVTTLAGSPGNSGSADGTGGAARFFLARGIAADGSGNVFVADTSNHAMRKIVVSTGAVTTLAGSPGITDSADGTGSAAGFRYPAGIAADGSGNLFVADTSNHTIRKIVVATGAVTTLAGLAGSLGSADGTGSAARFYYPQGIAFDGAGNVYVTDTYNYTIRRIVVATGAVTTLAGTPGASGSADGIGGAAQFGSALGIAADGDGNVYVADSENNLIRRIVVATGAVTTLAGLARIPGDLDGTGSAALFRFPSGIVADRAGNVFVADTQNDSIRKIVVVTGAVTTLAGVTGGPWGRADGTGGAAQFSYPSGIAADGSGNLYVADTYNQTIRKIEVATRVVTTLAGSPGNTGSADGTGSDARFDYPSGIAADLAGDLFVADKYNHCIRRTVTPLADLATIDAPGGKVGEQRQLGTSPQAATSWSWQEARIEPGSTAALSSTSIRNPTFTPDLVGTYVFLLTASNGASTSVSTVSLQAISRSATASATVSGTTSICRGATTTIQAALAGVAPWSVVWFDGVTQSVQASPVTRSVAPAATTTYAVTTVSDSNGPGATVGSATVTVAPLPIAIARGDARIQLGQSTRLSGSGASNCSWTPVAGLDDPNSCTPFASPGSTTIYSLTVWDTGGCTSNNTWAQVLINVIVPPSTSFYPLTPCRFLDTRSPNVPLQPGATSTFVGAFTCEIPYDAVAISANLTVTNVGAPGELVVFPEDVPKPTMSTICFRAGVTRANNAIISLSQAGAMFSVFNDSAATVDLILDVNGYFR